MEIGIVRQVDIEERMKSAYLDYAMSVITARALPDVRDGLKPVQRRILYAMNDMGLQSDKPYKKSARIVGEVLGKYHPHGDAAVYDAMVRMAQDFTMRYLVIDGQGNFGSVDGDNPAAMRYTEARLAPISAELLADIDKETVDYMDNFDGTLGEPTVLPARVPNLLLNGAAGIAVGMATNVPPHNLNEICDAAIFLIDRYSRLDSVSVDELMQLIKGPDFPTGGTILGLEGIRSAYATGKGSITMRAKAHFEDAGGGKSLIVITELPYQVGKAALIERIAELVRDKKIETLSDLRDESDRQGMRIVLELKRGVEPRPALMQLYKYTPMQSNFNVNLLALVEGEPRVLSLKRVLQLFTEHRLDVITRRSRYELERAEQRVHILEGLRTALDHLDEVIDTIRRSRNADTALLNLQRIFNFTEVQARAILDLQLRRLAALERHKIDEEYSETLKRIKYLAGLLRSRQKILAVIKSELQELKARYGDERRTRISEKEADEIRVEDLISEEDVFVAVTQAGYVKRISRQGNPLSRMAKDAIQHLTETNTLHRVLFCTNKGRCYTSLVHQIPNSQGPDVLLSDLLSLESDERVRAVVDVPDVEGKAYLTLCTVQGRVKRIPVEEFSAVRAGGLSAISLDDGDEVGWAQLTDGNRELILVTAGGQALRFAESEIRPMGRSAAGVYGIRLAAKDHVVGMDLVEDNGFLLVVTEKGYAKRTPLSDYRPQGRYTQGVATIAAGVDQSGPIAAACVIAQNDDIAVLRSSSAAVTATASEIPVRGRSTRGTRALELKGKDAVCGLTRLAARPKTRPPTGAATVSTRTASSSRRRTAGGSTKRGEISPRPQKRKGTGGGKAPAPRTSRSQKKTKKSQRK